MNYSLMLYPWCKRSREWVLKGKRWRKFKTCHAKSLCTWTVSFLKGFCFVIFPPNHISSALSASAEWELPGADKSPVICQTSPRCPPLLFFCILLSVIESANSEKLFSIWTRPRVCGTHSMADFSATHSWPRCLEWCDSKNLEEKDSYRQE